MPTDPNPPVTPVDTTGVVGATGPLPYGTARVASNADTTIFGGGGGEDPNAGNSNLGTIDTTGTNSPNDPALYAPYDGDTTGTPDSIQGAGGMRLDKNQAYRAPSGPVAASNADTTRTDSPTSGTILVTNKAYVKSTKVATITTDQVAAGTMFSVGSIAVLVGVDANLDGTVTIVSAPSAGVFTFSTDKPSGDIVSAAVVGGSVSMTTTAYLSGTLDSYSVGAVAWPSNNVPGAPTGVSAVANADGTVTVSWTPPAPVSGMPTRGFLVQSSQGYSHWAAANATSHTTDLWTLEASRAITFTVAARNDNGLGAQSAASGSVTPVNVNFAGYAAGEFSPDAQINPIYAPSGGVNFLFAGVQNRNGINFSWNLPATNHAYTGGVLKVFDSTGAQVGSDYVLAGSATSQAVTGLTYGATYTATLSFTNSVGTITEDPITVKINLLVPAAAAAPTGVDAGGGTHNATITYADPADTGGSAITSHVIQWSSDSFATVAGSTTDAVSPATAAAGAGTWKFRVAAVNAIGQGAFSAASANVTVA